MGTTSSQATINQITESIFNVSMQTVQDCVVTSTQKQVVKVKNTGFKLFSKYDISQQTEVSSTCFADSNKEAQLQSSIASAISNTSTSEGVALWPIFGGTKSQAETNIKDILKGYVNMDNIQKAYTQIMQEQQTDFENESVILVDLVDISQGAQVFAAATVKQVTKSGILSTIKNQIDQSSSATTENPFSFLSDMSMAFMVFILFIVFIILAIIFYSIWAISS